MPDPHLRAADADRAAVADALGAHMSAGRLTVAEFDERLARAYAARTYGDLEPLTADLPPLAERTPSALPGSLAPRTGTRPAPHPFSCHRTWSDGWDTRDAWRSWLTTGLVVLTIWAVISVAAGELRYFWPVWVIGPWGAILLVQTLARRGMAGSAGHRRQLPGAG